MQGYQTCNLAELVYKREEEWKWRLKLEQETGWQCLVGNLTHRVQHWMTAETYECIISKTPYECIKTLVKDI